MAERRIFVDMDGVLSDFDKRYFELFGVPSLHLREIGKHKEYRKNWKQFVEGDNFTLLDFAPGAQELIFFLNSLKVEKVILSSSAGFEFYENILMQKITWLKKRGINWAPIIVPGKRYKKGFANRESILIDDTSANIMDFIEAGGNAVLHKDYKHTINKVTEWFVRNPVTNQLPSSEIAI